MIDGGGISHPILDVTNIGGVTPWMKTAHLAECHNRPVSTHGVHDLHVHLLAAIPNALFLEAHGCGMDAFQESRLPIKDGHVMAPDTPGHGVVFDWDALAPHAG